MPSSTVSSIRVGVLKAARLEAGRVLAQQPGCQSSHPITLDMTFKVGRRKQTKCPHLLRTRPAVEPLCSICGRTCLCVLWLWPDLVWHKDSCHISNLSHATQRRCQRPGQQETQGRTQGRVCVPHCVCMCVCPCVWRSKEDGGCGVGGHVKGFDSEAPSNLDVHTRAGTLFSQFLKPSPGAVESQSPGHVVNTASMSSQHP